MIIYRFTAKDELYKYLNIPPGTLIDRRYTMYDIIIQDYMRDETVLERLGDPAHLYDLFLEEFKYEVTYESIVDKIDMTKFMDIMRFLAESNELCLIWLGHNQKHNSFEKINNRQVLLDIEEEYIRSLEPFSTQVIRDKTVKNNVKPDFLLEQLCYFHALNLSPDSDIPRSYVSDVMKKSIIKRFMNERYLKNDICKN
jgi:hypothetical protein